MTLTRTRTRLSATFALAAGLILGTLLPFPAPAGALGPGDAWISGLEGAWAGEENRTPMGPMSFAFLFDRQPDGSLRAHSAYDRETYVDLHFLRDETGRWLLKESASLAGLGHQSYTLAPAEKSGDGHRWLLAEDPGLVVVDVTLEGTRLLLDVQVRGEPHARFDLQRLPDAEVPGLREALEAQAARDPAETPPLHEVLAEERLAEAIREARGLVEADPRDVDAHLRLADALIEAISADPLRGGPAFAADLLKALETARALDPSRPEPYHGLAGYFLNAPPIAGGSVEKAVEMARLLEQVDPDAGALLLAQIEERARP